MLVLLGKSLLSPLVPHLEHAVGVLLRLPGLFLIDAYSRHVLTTRPRSLLLSHFGESVGRRRPSQPTATDPISLPALLNGFLLLLLPLAHLKRYYLHLVCWAIIFSSLYLSQSLLHFDSTDDTQLFPTYFHSNIYILKILNKDVFQLFLLHLTFDAIILTLLQASHRIIASGNPIPPDST